VRVEGGAVAVVLPVAAASAWLSSYAGWRAGLPAVLLIAVGSAVAGAVLAALRRRSVLLAVAVLVGVMPAGLVAVAARAAAHPGFVTALAARQATVAVDAVVTGDPHLAAASVRPLAVVPARLAGVTTDEQYRVGAPVVLLADDVPSWLPLLPGQRVHVVGRLAPTDPRDTVAAVLLTRGPPDLIGVPPWHQRVAGRLREGLRSAVSGLPATERGLVPGVVVGDTSGLDPQLRNDFRTVGMTHLVAVSGQTFH
jgi:competence protein ComEC